MDSLSRGDIQWWLSKIQDPVPSNTPKSYPDVSFAGTGLPEDSKKAHDLEKKYQYEHKARHKTKEDRYEYKDKSTRVNSALATKKERKLLASRIRKHTINDEFHALNVPTNRLTLRRSMNMGLFQMGKTSSPVKSRRVSNLAFSEKEFLSKISRNGDEEPVVIEKAEQHETRQSISDSVGKSAHPNHQYISHQKEIQRELSITPTTTYTWSESARIDSDLDRSFESFTERLLYFDLDAHAKNEAIVAVNSAKKYWTLGELKGLLRERMRAWDLQSNLHSMPEQQPLPLPTRNRKRKLCPSIEEETITTQRPNKFRKCGPFQQAENGDEIEPVGSSNANTVFGLEKICDELQHILFNQRVSDWTSVPNQGNTSSPKSDSKLTPGPSMPADASTHIQNATPAVYNYQCSEPLETVEAGSIIRCEIERGNYNPWFGVIEEESLGADHYETLFSEALDAAYDVIVHSEESSTCGVPDHANADPTTDTVSTASNESMVLVSQERWVCGLSNETHSGCYHNNTESTLNSAVPTYDVGDQVQQSFTTPSNHGVHQRHWTESELETRPRNAPAWRLGKPREGNENALGLEMGLLGGLKGFWRQNKLY